MRTIYIVHQEGEEVFQALDADAADELKAQIRAELGEPEAPVIVMPPNCSLNVFCQDQPEGSDCPDDCDCDEDDPCDISAGPDGSPQLVATLE